MNKLIPALCIALGGCAAALPPNTMFGRVVVPRGIHITSTPPGAYVEYDTHEGKMVACKETPCYFDAPDAFGFYSTYTLRASKPGYATAEQSWHENHWWDAQEVIPREVSFDMVSQ